MAELHTLDKAQLLAAIVDSSDDAIVSNDLDGVITSWNGGAERMFGYVPSEVVGKSVHMLIPPARASEEDTILERIRKGEAVSHFETVRLTKSGRSLHISLSVSPIRDNAGRVVGASKVARDISKQLDVTERLRRSEERFRVTLVSIGEAVISTDASLRVTFMNPSAEHLTGRTFGEACGMNLGECFRLLDEFTREPLANPAEESVSRMRGAVVMRHGLLITREGFERPIESSASPIWEASGELGGVVLTFRDISDRRAAERSAQRLAAIVHGSDDAIVGKDLNGIVTNWNDGAERIFGYTEAEMVGRSILTLIPPELHGEEDVILKSLRAGKRVEHFETERVAKDGHRVSVSITVSPIKDMEGHVIGASKIARDITERRRVENELRRVQDALKSHATELEAHIEERTAQLKKSVSELEAFSYSLSHDMRAPLRAMQSFLEIVIEDYGGRLDAAGIEMLKKAVSAAQRMDRMVLDLLAFTRLSHTAMTMEDLDVEQLVRSVIMERAEFQEPRAQVVIDSPLERVVGNVPSLLQCFVNVLDNAVKFVPAGVMPQVRVASRREANGRVCISFEDNGIGVDKKSNGRVFEMFQRGTAEAYPGTGIGLAIVRKAAERMGGEAGLEPREGGGSRFWLSLRGATT